MLTTTSSDKLLLQLLTLLLLDPLASCPSCCPCCCCCCNCCCSSIALTSSHPTRIGVCAWPGCICSARIRARASILSSPDILVPLLLKLGCMPDMLLLLPCCSHAEGSHFARLLLELCCETASAILDPHWEELCGLLGCSVPQPWAISGPAAAAAAAAAAEACRCHLYLSDGLGCSARQAAQQNSTSVDRQVHSRVGQSLGTCNRPSSAHS